MVEPKTAVEKLDKRKRWSSDQQINKLLTRRGEKLHKEIRPNIGFRFLPDFMQKLRFPNSSLDCAFLSSHSLLALLFPDYFIVLLFFPLTTTSNLSSTTLSRPTHRSSMFRATLTPALKLSARRAPAFIEKRFTTILCVRKDGKVVSIMN